MERYACFTDFVVASTERPSQADHDYSVQNGDDSHPCSCCLSTHEYELAIVNKVQIGYFVHDLHDAAVARRVGMFLDGGAAVRLGGFRRGAVVATVRGLAPVDLGRTGDLRLVQRALAVLRNLVLRRAARHLSRGADILVARNLEALAIAAAVRRPGQRLVYECLDIHRLLLGTGAPSRLLRAIERRLLAGVDLVIVSSPAFEREYFRARRGFDGPILLVENKVPEAAAALHQPRPAARSRWRIAWLGMLRCRKSLLQLRAIADAADGAVEVVIAGRVTCALIPDFDDIVASSSHLTFVGAYAPADLARLYGAAHFAWAIDYYEEGLNSRWLLPNRLYEGLAHGAVPLALADVEIGRWLARHGVGQVLDDPVAQLPALLAKLRPEDHAAMVAKIRAMPAGLVMTTGAECAALVAAMAGTA